MSCVKFTYDELSGTVLMLNFRFNAMMRDLLKREMAPKPEEPVNRRSRRQANPGEREEMKSNTCPGSGTTSASWSASSTSPS